MKIVNEKGKLFGIINLVDLLMIVAVIAVVIAAVGLLKSDAIVSGNTDAEYVQITFTVRVRSMLPETFEPYLAAVEGKMPLKLVAGQAYLPNFYIVDCTTAPIPMTTTDEAGNVREIDDVLNRRDVIYVITGVIVNPNKPIYSAYTQEVRIGNSFYVKTELIEHKGTVETLTIGEPFANDEYDPDKPEDWAWQPQA